MTTLVYRFLSTNRVNTWNVITCAITMLSHEFKTYIYLFPNVNVHLDVIFDNQFCIWQNKINWKGHGQRRNGVKRGMLSPDYTIEQVVSSLLYETFCFLFLSGLHGIYIYIYISVSTCIPWAMQTCWHSLIWVKVMQESVRVNYSLRYLQIYNFFCLRERYITDVLWLNVK